MTTPRIQLLDEAETLGLHEFLVERIYEFNSETTGYYDGKLFAGTMRDDSGEIIAAFDGHTWGGSCEITHLWVHPTHRRRGLGRALLQAAETEALRRGCAQIVLSTGNFQAPLFYERLGFEKKAEIKDHPKGYANLIYVKQLRNP